MSDRPIKLLIIDDDPIFRLGLCTALASFEDIAIVAQTDNLPRSLDLLAESSPDLVILEPELRLTSAEQLSGWELCQEIKQRYPALPICLLSASVAIEQLQIAKSSGIEGYCPKGKDIRELVGLLRQLARGETNWQAIERLSLQEKSGRGLPVRRRSWLFRLHQSGLQQIEATLMAVGDRLDNPQLSGFDRLFWQGRRRELRAARWLVERLFPVETIILPPTPSNELKEIPNKNADSALVAFPAYSNIFPPLMAHSPTATTVFNNTLAKIQLGIHNSTHIPLEIDILQTNKKQELFYLVINQFRKVLEELRFLNITREQLLEKRTLVLRDLFESSILDFFSKYYTLIDLNENKIVDIFSQDSIAVQEEILEEIPMVVELLDYFLFETPLAIDGILYRPQAPEVIERAEILLQNLIDRVANAVVQVILNNFSDLEIIKQQLYQKKYLSSREIAKFRNELSWRYRTEKYWQEPTHIFESKHRLFFLDGKNLAITFIYAPRQAELDRLSGIRWAVTIALEIRDAISPRLRSVVALVGKGLVYVLTQVIGRGIGLIGRGIVQGVGNTFQDVRYGNGKNSQRIKRSTTEMGDRKNYEL